MLLHKHSFELQVKQERLLEDNKLNKEAIIIPHKHTNKGH